MGKGLLKQIKETYYYPPFTRDAVRDFMLNEIGSPEYRRFWHEHFNEPFEEFVDKMLGYERNRN